MAAQPLRDAPPSPGPETACGEGAGDVQPPALPPAESRGHIAGNFWNYASFHPATVRIDVMRQCPHISAALRRLLGACAAPTLLDVGANSGELTLSLRSFVREFTGADGSASLRTLGLELDPELVRRASELAAEDAARAGGAACEFEAVDALDTAAFDGACARFLGGGNGARFTLVTAMSVTMWIHLRVGDRGLRQFLRTLAARATALLVEPQPPKCYRSARRRVRKLKLGAPFATEAIQLALEDVIPDIKRFLLEECGFSRCIEASAMTGWDRQPLLFLRDADA